MGASAVAAKSCFQSTFAAFGPGRFHGGFGGGSKNPASEALLLPLTLASFFGSSAVAAKS
jgi:hypothetical protein